MIAAWQTRRMELSHDWLQNRYFQKVSTIVRVLEGSVQSDIEPRNFVNDLLAEWNAQAESLRELIEEFDSAMSPATLLNRPRLNALDCDLREAIAAVLNRAWVRKNGVCTLKATALQALEGAKIAALELASFDPASAHSPTMEVANFRTALSQLSRALHQFPSEIQLP